MAQHINGVFRFDPDAYTGQFYDLAGIDVARGPSGTVYGRNATSGAINARWRKPHEEIDVFGDATLGNYERLDFRGGLNWPVIEPGDDRLMARFAFQKLQHDGYLDNFFQPDRSKDPGSQDLDHIRASFRSVVSEALEIDVRGFYTRDFPGDGASKPRSALPTVGLISGIPLEPYRLAQTPSPDPRRVSSTSFDLATQQLQHWGVDGEALYQLDAIPLLPEELPLSGELGGLDLVGLGGVEWRRLDQVSDADGTEIKILDTASRRRHVRGHVRPSGLYDGRRSAQLDRRLLLLLPHAGSCSDDELVADQRDGHAPVRDQRSSRSERARIRSVRERPRSTSRRRFRRSGASVGTKTRSR